MNTSLRRFRRGDVSPERPGLVFEGYKREHEYWVAPAQFEKESARKRTPEHKVWLKQYQQNRRKDKAAAKRDAETGAKRERLKRASITSDFHRGDPHPASIDLFFWKYKHGTEKWVTGEELLKMRKKANKESASRYARLSIDAEKRIIRQHKQRVYVAKNRKRINAWYVQNRANNPDAKLASRIRSCIRDSTLRQNAHKRSRSVDLLGCSIPEFRCYMENQFTEGMSWELFACGDIEIDHRIPLASFELTDPIQQQLAFNFRNCRPMWAVENKAKLDRITVNGQTVLGRHVRGQNIIPFEQAA